MLSFVEEYGTTLDSLLSDDVNLRETDAYGNTLLHVACKLALGEYEPETPPQIDGSPEATSSEIACRLAALLRARASDDLSCAHRWHNNDGYTPLHVAIAHGSAPICEVLLAAGASVNVRTLPLAWHLYPVVQTHLCGQWARRDKSGKMVSLQAPDQTALHLAVGLLVERGGSQPASSEAMSVDESDAADTRLVRLLMSHDADLNALDSSARTPLQVT